MGSAWQLASRFPDKPRLAQSRQPKVVPTASMPFFRRGDESQPGISSQDQTRGLRAAAGGEGRSCPSARPARQHQHLPPFHQVGVDGWMTASEPAGKPASQRARHCSNWDDAHTQSTHVCLPQASIPYLSASLVDACSLAYTLVHTRALLETRDFRLPGFRHTLPTLATERLSRRAGHCAYSIGQPALSSCPRRSVCLVQAANG